MGTTQEICSLVLDACDLVERYGDLGYADERVEREAQLLRTELCAALGACSDDAVAGDVEGAVAEVDALLTRLATLPAREVALSA